MMMSESQSGTSSGNDYAGGEIMLFGVRLTVDPMRKSVSMNDLSQYITRDSFVNSNIIDNKNLDASAVVAADNGYASADDAVRNLSNAGKERKRGAPWTEDEHKLFLLGLEKVGKGDWRGISRNFVKTRTPTQVASHAQKYFLRRTNLNRRRRRSSIFDIPTDLVAAIPMEENQVHQDKKSQPAQISPLSGFPIAAFTATVGPVQSPLQTENEMETKTFNNGNKFNEGSTLVRPIALLPPKREADFNVNQKHDRNSSSLSLNLSLSWDNNQSTFQVMPGCNNGNGIISVG